VAHNRLKENAVYVRRIGIAALASTAALAIAACGSSSGSGSSSSNGSGSSKGSSSGSQTSVSTLTGAGSTLVQPLVEVWAPVYQKSFGTVITYGGIGSGGGIESITSRTVDFGASDAPLTGSQEGACKGCLEIPWALAATTIAYHVAGVPSHLHFTGAVLADIWLGKITKWNAPQIRALNPGVKLPSTTIVPVHRTDGSGDTFAFTNYLDHVSPTFKTKIGAPATTVSWPGGVGGKGNSGVGAVLSSTNGAIAYIAIAYVLENHFDLGLVQNAAGSYPMPGIPSIEAAAAAFSSVPAGGESGVSIVDPPASAAGAYPISTFTYILIPKATGSAYAVALKKFVGWAITTGQSPAYTKDLDFAPLPAAVVKADQSTLDLIR
jgi:phosphate transport system substrate-binding protein